MIMMMMKMRRRTRWVNRTIISKKRWRHWYCPEWCFDCADGDLDCGGDWTCLPYVFVTLIYSFGFWAGGAIRGSTELVSNVQCSPSSCWNNRLPKPLAWLLKPPVLQATSYLLTKPEAGLSTEQLICRWAPPEEYAHHWGSLDHYPLSVVEKERMVNGSNSSNDQKNESFKDPQGIIRKRPGMVSEDPNDFSIFFTARPTINAQRMWSAAARVHSTDRQRVWSTFP